MGYRRLNDLQEWDDPGVILVEVTPDGMAHVRDITWKTIPVQPTSVPDALRRAESMLAANDWHREIVVRVQDGAQWNDQWGDLISDDTPL